MQCLPWVASWVWLLLVPWRVGAAGAFTVATYNLENYLEQAQGSRAAKPAVSKAQIQATLRELNADVLALQEIDGPDALHELQTSLRAHGLDYPHEELVTGFDTNLHVAVLSKFPLVARRPHPRENFLLHGRRFQVTRGFAEVDVQVNPRFVFTLISAHLKSRRPVPTADEAEIREQEAVCLRAIIDARLYAQPEALLVVAGDFNDTQDANSVKTIVGRGAGQLVDTRPAERNGDNQPNPNPRYRPRIITWTHYYALQDSFSRIDYLLMSRRLARFWDRAGTFVLALPNWGVASDHRPIVARFVCE